MKRYIWFAVAAAWLLFIWGNSLQTAAESSNASLGVMGLIAPVLSWVGVPEELWHTLVRKLAHMTEFAVLAVFWSGAFRTWAGEDRRSRWSRRGAVLFLCVAAALLDETIQMFVPGRGSAVMDVWIDTLGSALGILAVTIISEIKRKMR